MDTAKFVHAAAIAIASFWWGGCASTRRPAAKIDSPGRTQLAETNAPSETLGANRRAYAGQPGLKPNPQSLAEYAQARPQISDAPPEPLPEPKPNPLEGEFNVNPYENRRRPVHVENLFSKEYGKLVLEDVKEVFTAPYHWRTKEWITVGVIGGGIAGLTFADKCISKTVQANRNDTLDSVANNIAPLGEVYSFGILGGFYLGGLAFDDPRARAVAQDGLSASLIICALTMPIMKYRIGRFRPDQDHGSHAYDAFNLGCSSMPSGHTAQAFAVASVIAGHYDSWWIKVLSYGTAAAVGWSRVEQHRHWTSDVVAGAVIGTFVGTTVVHVNQRRRAAGSDPKVTFAPFYDGKAAGLSLSWKF